MPSFETIHPATWQDKQVLAREVARYHHLASENPLLANGWGVSGLRPNVEHANGFVSFDGTCLAFVFQGNHEEALHFVSEGGHSTEPSGPILLTTLTSPSGSAARHSPDAGLEGKMRVGRIQYNAMHIYIYILYVYIPTYYIHIYIYIET